MDDIDILRRRRTIKVLITDLFMAMSVVAIVIVLVAAVAGWRINSDFTVEQNGLVSIKTRPTGATVIIDDETVSQATNMSKMLSGGKHKIALEKDGYERWEKEVEVTPGWLLRLEYPRLFKQNREKSTIRDFKDLKFFYVSPDRSTAIYNEDGSTNWVVITDFSGTPKFKQVDIKGIFDNTDDGKYRFKINSIEWNKNSEKILISTDGDTDEWGIIDLKNIKDSINLTEDYPRFEANSDNLLASAKKAKKAVVTQAKFENEAGDKVIAIASNNLVRIDTVSKTITGPIAEDAVKFAIHDQIIAYLTKFEEGKSYIKIIRLGEKTPTIVAVNSDKKAVISFALTRFNSTSYLLYTIGNRIVVHKANDFHTNGGNKLNMSILIDSTIGILPSVAEVSYNKEFIALREGSRVVIFDTELEKNHEYDYGNEKVRYLDNYLMYRVDEASGTFLTWDFDSTNVRTLVVDNAVNDFDALITNNNKYFYYIAKTTYIDDNNKTKTGYTLVRENL